MIRSRKNQRIKPYRVLEHSVEEDRRFKKTPRLREANLGIARSSKAAHGLLRPKLFGAQSVLGGVREYDKGLRTPLAGFFNFLEMNE